MNTASTPASDNSAPPPPVVRGLPILGNTLEMARDPAKFFYRAYEEYGPIFRVKVLGSSYTCIAGVEAAEFLGSRAGKESLRSKEVWQPLMREFGASKMLSAEDGELHKQLRGVMKWGFSKEVLRGRYDELVQITDRVIERDWKVATKVPVVQTMQYMVVEQLGTILTGSAPLEYVKDIRTTILYILNVLVTRQRPRFLIHMPHYKHAKARMFELGREMIASYHKCKRTDDSARPRTLIDDVMDAHQRDPQLIPERDLIMLVTGPFVAGLDTVANTTSAVLYFVLKHPQVLALVQKEVDEIFAKQPVDEQEFMKSLPLLNGAIMESMRQLPIAVAQIRIANRDFVFHGRQVREGERVYLGTSVPHFQPALYPNPEKFDIDRYQKSRAEHLQVGAYSPFGRGPHTCLGKSLAEVQLAITMGQLFYRLDMSLDPPGYNLKTKTAPTPGPTMGFKVKINGFRH
jgi:cytochrome P450